MTTYVKEHDAHDVAFKVNTDLTGVTASAIYLKQRQPNSIVVTDDVTVTDALTGLVTWPYDGDLPVGMYDVEIEFTRGSDKVTAPSQGYYTLVVECDLNDA